jgi:putative acetyltransferase
VSFFFPLLRATADTLKKLWSVAPLHLRTLALAPMAVLPEFQNQGLGSALVRRGLEVCKEQGHRIVIVLGHPHFYQRFGFSSNLAARLESPYSGRESFMAGELIPGALDGVAGRVQYPPPFEAWS